MSYKLILLFKSLIDGNLDPKRVNSMFSSKSSYDKFISSLRASKDIRYLGEYLAILRDDGDIAVVGIDDTKKLFCEIIPSKVASDYFKILSNQTLRAMMGFDKHLQEVNAPIDGIRVRLQGEIIVEFLRVFPNLRRLWGFLRLYLLHSLLAPSLHFVDPSLERTIVNKASELKIEFPNANSLLDKVLKLLTDPRCCSERSYLEFIVGLIASALLFEDSKFDVIDLNLLRKLLVDLKIKASRFVRRLFNLEKQYTIRIGKHTINLIGIRMTDLNVRVSYFNENSFYTVSLPGKEMQTFIIARRQTISAFHPDHFDARLSVEPSIIRFATLRVRGKMRVSTLALNSSIMRTSVYFPVEMLARLSRLEKALDLSAHQHILVYGGIQIGVGDKVKKEHIGTLKININTKSIEFHFIKILNEWNIPSMYFMATETGL